MDNLCCFSSKSSGGNSAHGAGKGRGSQGPIKFGYNLVKGKASHPMEDYHVAKFVQHQGRELGLFAIYDGHLGDSVPAYLQKHLFHNILKEEEFWTDPSRSISKAYERTDQAILTHNPDLGRGGSTAVTAMLINGQVLWVANVGDSRAVLSRRGQAIQMSVDHEPNTERGSIENKGGFVSNMPGTDGGSEAYFPEWIFHQLEQEREAGSQIEEEMNSKIAKKLTIVGLWCINWHPADRPSIKHVIQMLQEENYPAIPPNPFFSANSKIASTFNNRLDIISESD